MRVAVIGAGFSGLRAAMLLEQAGAEVVVFEARNRLGGRCETVVDDDGSVYEAGGEWIDADHARVLSLLREFSQEPISRPEWPRRLRFKGREANEATIWQDALEDDLRVESAAKEMCRDLRAPVWANGNAYDLDARNLGDFLREHTESDRGLWWVNSKYRSDEGDDLDRIGLLGWLGGFMHYLDREGDELSSHRFPGGASALCDRMAASLRQEVRFASVVRRVTQDTLGVTLQFEDGPTERFERVILTLPPRCLEDVVFEPPLGAAKRCAVEACGMSRAIKIALRYERAWWTESGWGGSLQTDEAIQQTWDGTLGERPVLNLYICGDEALQWLRQADPVQTAADQLAAIYPESAGQLLGGGLHDWINDPYARGAFSHLPPRYVLEHMPDIVPPEGRVHFAGEHTANWVGFIEGALESAERVVPEVVR
ncbi:FAD-dependent oxidoreductase [bacterium]|nr:MAG: FAD-dependent oxidoreductase [bacterium]